MTDNKLKNSTTEELLYKCGHCKKETTDEKEFKTDLASNVDSEENDLCCDDCYGYVDSDFEDKFSCIIKIFRDKKDL